MYKLGINVSEAYHKVCIALADDIIKKRIAQWKPQTPFLWRITKSCITIRNNNSLKWLWFKKFYWKGFFLNLSGTCNKSHYLIKPFMLTCEIWERCRYDPYKFTKCNKYQWLPIWSSLLFRQIINISKLSIDM